MEVDNKLAMTIIKWVIVVFIAGFIGQFGKSLTKHFLKWFRERKAKKQDAKGAHKEKPSEKFSKLEKKRQKAEIKRLKKGK